MYRFFIQRPYWLVTEDYKDKRIHIVQFNTKEEKFQYIDENRNMTKFLLQDTKNK